MDHPEESFQLLPADFRERLDLIVPAQFKDEVSSSFSAVKATAFRVNRLKTDAATVIAELSEAGIHAKPVSWFADAFVIDSTQRSELTHHRLAESGEVYLQNLSSMAAVLVLDPQADEVVLDLAAAPGGKTLHIAAAMQGQGMLSAVEVVKGRFFKLKENLRRGGAEYVRTYLMDGREVARKTGPRFDRVLLDAPCSSEARFRANVPESFKIWSLRKVAECRKKQRGLVKSAFNALKPGGTLVYSTCSFSPEENESVIADLLKRFSDSASIESFDLGFDNWQVGLSQWQGKAFPESLHVCRRILPNQSMDGLFIAKIKKDA